MEVNVYISLLSHGDIIKNRRGVMIFNPIKIANVTVSIIVLCPMSLTILIISGWLDKYNCPRMMDLIHTQERTNIIIKDRGLIRHLESTTQKVCHLMNAHDDDNYFAELSLWCI